MKNQVIYIILLLISNYSFTVNAQDASRDSVWLTYRGQSVIEPFDSISVLDPLFSVWKNDYFSFEFLDHSFDTSDFYVYEARYPFGKDNTYSYEDGSDYYLTGDVYFFTSKTTNKIHGIFATWIVLEKHDSLINTPEYMCELISRASHDALPGLKDFYKCKDHWTYEKVNNRLSQKVVLEAPEPDENIPLDPIYYVSYTAIFD